MRERCKHVHTMILLPVHVSLNAPSIVHGFIFQDYNDIYVSVFLPLPLDAVFKL